MPNRKSQILNRKSKSGTREWSEHSVNIQLGCEYGCRYCYAKYDAVCRYGRCIEPDWARPVMDQKKVDGRFGKYRGVVMFPTCHDITPRNLSECLVVLRKLLEAGNQVLIVTKPAWSCITMICEMLKDFRNQVTFRFTIGSGSPNVLKFWEPRAPGLAQRLGCLQYASESGYATSVSCEPFLDPWPQHVYEACLPWLTDSFWLGLLNRLDQRVDLGGVPAELIERFVTPVRKTQAPAMLKEYYKLFKNLPKVKFKKEFRDAVGI